MTRNIRPAAVPHDVAHRPRGSGPSSGFRDIAVRRNITNRNPANDRQDEVLENGHLEEDPDSNATLQTARLHREGASLYGAEIDIGARVTDDSADSH